MRLIILLCTFNAIYGCASLNSIPDQNREDIFNNYYEGNLSIGDTSVFNTLIKSINNSEIGINGSMVITRNHDYIEDLAKSRSGKIYINVCINREGHPVFVNVQPNTTTIKDRKTLESALLMAMNYKYEPDTTAALYECGNLKYFLNIKD